MHSGGFPKRFKPCNLPSNDYAFKHLAFLSPGDFQDFQQKQVPPSSQLFLEVNALIMRAEKLQNIPPGQIGLSKFQRDCLMISRDDEVEPRVARIIHKNPLNFIDITIGVLFVDESYPRDKNGAFKVHEKDIAAAVRDLFNAKFINRGEIAPLTMYEGQIIFQIKVDKIENIEADYRHLSYGTVE